jgi:murein L,D-transpeptidase YafK
MIMKKWFILLFFLLLGGIIWRFGRSLYMPVLLKMKGKETMESINKKIGKKVKQRLKSDLDKIGLEELPERIVLYAMKEEQLLEVYAVNPEGLQLLKTYPFTAFSGKIGPKLKEGDLQIPEGIYQVAYLNPNSSYYLSMKINYPNAFDRKKGALENRTDLGTNIFIHGKAATVGCIPIGDEAIEELFILAEKAVNQGIKVVISPKDFRKDATFPKIDFVDWEAELYEQILMEIKQLGI